MGRAASLIVGVLATSVALAAGCNSPQPQPQLLVIIDTDVSLPAQLAADPARSPGASFDRIKFGMLQASGKLAGLDAAEGSTLEEIDRTFAITEKTTWPISFGIGASDEGDRDVFMRIQAYREDSVEYNGIANLVDERLRIDRLVKLRVPEDGTETVRIVLSGECFGTPSEPEKSFQTCITGPNDIRDASEGIERITGPVPATLAGSWERARALPCERAQPNGDAVCIPSGLFVRGDENFEELLGDYASSFPRHLVHVRPYFLDRHEMTVRRFRAILARGAPGVVAPPKRSPEAPTCTWSDSPADLEDRPLNCVSQAIARAVCNAEGGDLPTDAQWELAARRRLGGAYVWGSQQAACCAAAIGGETGCSYDEPRDVGSFSDPTACDGRADVTREGVLDLAGNVREHVRDSWTYYGTPDCSLPPIAEDPLCIVPQTRQLTRGGSFRSTFDQAKIAARASARIADNVGFRCAYAGAP